MWCYLTFLSTSSMNNILSFFVLAAFARNRIKKQDARRVLPKTPGEQTNPGKTKTSNRKRPLETVYPKKTSLILQAATH